jgi:hypothetical protein
MKKPLLGFCCNNRGAIFLRFTGASALFEVASEREQQGWIRPSHKMFALEDIPGKCPEVLRNMDSMKNYLESNPTRRLRIGPFFFSKPPFTLLSLVFERDPSNNTLELTLSGGLISLEEIREIAKSDEMLARAASIRKKFGCDSDLMTVYNEARVDLSG